MKTAPLPHNEAERLADLYRYGILDTAAEAEFDDLTELAAHLCGVPIALISLVDVERLWFKSAVGLSFPEVPRARSFCSQAIHDNQVFEVADALKDERFFDSPLVTAAPDIRFYAGVPLVTDRGHAIGSLCVIDTVPRELSAAQKKVLAALGRQVMRQLDLRLLNAELERRVAARTADLQTSAHDLQMLSQSLAHDLRQPLISMSGYTTLLQQEVESERGKHCLQRVAAGVGQINLRADALLYFANLAHLSLKRQAVDLRKVALAHIHALQAAAPKRRVRAQVQDGLQASGDPELLRELMHELLDNAWRHTASLSLATLDVGSSTGADGVWVYHVRDNGAGFDMRYASSLFEPFQRLSTGDGEGEGIGLARVKRIAVKHGGRVWAECTPGQGASFYFTLSAPGVAPRLSTALETADRANMTP